MFASRRTGNGVIKTERTQLSNGSTLEAERKSTSPGVVELPEEGLEVLADDAVEHPMLGGATHVGSRGVGAKIGVKLHG